jgi:hypothetical protein
MIQKAHARQTKNQQGCGALFVRRKNRCDSWLVMIFEKMRAMAKSLQQTVQNYVNSAPTAQANYTAGIQASTKPIVQAAVAVLPFPWATVIRPCLLAETFGLS